MVTVRRLAFVAKVRDEREEQMTLQELFGYRGSSRQASQAPAAGAIGLESPSPPLVCV